MAEEQKRLLENFLMNGFEDEADKAKQVDFSNFQEKLDTAQRDGIEYLYEIEPQSQNLFYAGYFCEANTNNEKGTTDMKMFYNAQYRIKKVTIPFPALDLEYHPETRAPLVKGANYTNEISIDWFEDVYHSVQKYHFDWFNRWYSKEYDCFRCGIQGKFRKMVVVAFHYVNTNIDSIIPVPKAEPLFAFIIGGLIPKTLPAMTFDYSNDANESLINMTYNSGPIRWVYSKELGMGDDIRVDSLFVDDPLPDVKLIGNNLVITDRSNNINAMKAMRHGDIDKIDTEKLRIARSATYYQSSEGSL